MAQHTPYIGTSATRLLAMINADNKLVNPAFNLRASDIVFGAPLPYTDAQNRNTKVTLTATSTAPFEGITEVRYTRRPLDVLMQVPGNAELQVVIPSLPFTTYDILTQFNQLYGVTLELNEVVNQTYTTVASSYPLKINGATSLAWVESAFTFPVVRAGDTIPLSEAITVQALNGLVFTPPQAG